MYDHKKRLGLILFIVVFISIVWWSGLSTTLNLALLKRHSQYLKNFVQDSYVTALLLYIGSLALVVSLALPLSIFFLLISGFLFGPWLGAFYSVIGGTVGSSISFLSVRYLAYDWFKHTAGNALTPFNAELQKYGLYYVLFLQLLPITPFAVIAVLSALSDLSFRAFFLGTFLGIIPANIILAYTGKRLMSLNAISDIWSPELIVLLLGCALIAGIPIIINRYKHTP